MVTNLKETVRARIRSIPDFPKKGIMFRDITPLLNDRTAFMQVVDFFTSRYRDRGITRVVSIESRGFILGSTLAYNLGAGFVPVRKPGKLPFQTIRESYTLEYGQDALEMHTDAIRKGDIALIVDDLLATGGTIAATMDLIEQLGGKIVAVAFLIELTFLNGRERRSGATVLELSFLIELSYLHGRNKLGPRPVFALIDYPQEL